MTIYIESFMLENVLINFCLLRLVKISTKAHTTTFRLIVSSIIGAAFSLVGAMFLTNHIMLNIFKFVSGICMIGVCFKSKFKGQLVNFILLFVYTYALAGGIMALSGTSYITSFGAIMVSKISQIAVCVIVTILTYIFELVSKHFKVRLKTNSFIYSVTLFDGKRKIKLNAYLDTGNMLNVDGSGVLILDSAELCKLKNISMVDVCLNKNCIMTGTVSGSGGLKLYKIDRMQIKSGFKHKEFKNPYVATSLSSSFLDTNYQALLSPLFI